MNEELNQEYILNWNQLIRTLNTQQNHDEFLNEMNSTQLTNSNQSEIQREIQIKLLTMRLNSLCS